MPSRKHVTTSSASRIGRFILRNNHFPRSISQCAGTSPSHGTPESFYVGYGLKSTFIPRVLPTTSIHTRFSGNSAWISAGSRSLVVIDGSHEIAAVPQTHHEVALLRFL